ncbi:MAG: Crp/Fnr family transcriptional regulator [Fusobacteriaceae bacterium]|nr:Crp/Fnr family transcriptional regulator [Fusobacteriaceae bacterium]
MIDFLKKTNLFLGLKDEEIELLLNEVKFFQKKYVKGEYLAFKGDIVDKYMLVKSGSFLTEMTMSNGKTLQVEVINPGREIAPSFIFGKNNHFPVDIFAKEDSEIVYLHIDDLLSLLQKDRKVLLNILNSFSNKTQFLSSKLWFSNKTIEEKLTAYIFQNMKGDVFYLNNSIKNIADIFGVSRPSLSRVLACWVEEGIITKVENKVFKVEDIAKLKERM